MSSSASFSRTLPQPPRRAVALGVALVIAALVISALRPHDRATWLMEVAPVLVALPILLATRRRYMLTTLVALCLCVHALGMIIGGAYGYAHVPLGFWIADAFGLSRNPYDKLGHFVQGFVPALLAREILIRGAHVRGRRMLAFVVLCIALAISAGYELIEWGAAMWLGADADEFLGTQGDPWDTQTDMLFALIGAACALLLCSRSHDRQIARLLERERRASESRS